MQIHSLQVGPIGTNCYLLCDEEASVCAVIDPGGEAGRIRTAVENTGCKPCGIFLTHGHYDHTGAADELRAYWPEIPVYLNRRDRYEGELFFEDMKYEFEIDPQTGKIFDWNADLRD